MSDTEQSKAKSWRDVLKVHPAADAFPDATVTEVKVMAEDIKTNELHQRVALWEVVEGWPVTNRKKGKLQLLDGRTRLDAIQLLHAQNSTMKNEDGETWQCEGDEDECPSSEYHLFDHKGKPNENYFDVVGYYYADAPVFGKVSRGSMHPEQAISYVIAANILRRHLTYDQRAAIAADLAKMIAEQGKEARTSHLKQGDESPAVAKTQPRERAVEQAAKKMDVGSRAVSEVIAADKKQPGIIAQIKKGDVTVAQVRKPKPQAKPKLSPPTIEAGPLQHDPVDGKWKEAGGRHIAAPITKPKIATAQEIQAMQEILGKMVGYRDPKTQGQRTGYIVELVVGVIAVGGSKRVALPGPKWIAAVGGTAKGDDEPEEEAEPQPVAGGSSTPVEAETDHVADPRHGPIRELIQRSHEQQFGTKCEWDGREGKTLNRMLAANPSWTLEEITRMVVNHFASQAVTPARPGSWLSRLGEYAVGPLDRYGKLWEARNGGRKQQEWVDWAENEIRIARELDRKHSAQTQ